MFHFQEVKSNLEWQRERLKQLKKGINMSLTKEFNSANKAMKSAQYEARTVRNNDYLVKDLEDGRIFKINNYEQVLKFFTKVKG